MFILILDFHIENQWTSLGCGFLTGRGGGTKFFKFRLEIADLPYDAGQMEAKISIWGRYASAW